MPYKYFQRCFAMLLLITNVSAFAMEEAKVGQQTEMEHLMPLYEIWILDWMCSNPRYRNEIRSSRMDCIREVRNVLPRCNGEYRMKIPRNDSKAIGGRLRYRDFVAGYTRCLKKQHANWRVKKEGL
jgi:hypothetical protein